MQSDISNYWLNDLVLTLFIFQYVKLYVYLAGGHCASKLAIFDKKSIDIGLVFCFLFTKKYFFFFSYL